MEQNPFRAAPGSEPPVLAGRDGELAAVRAQVALSAAGNSARPIVLVGLRGMGKTALLRHCLRDAERDADAVVVQAEASADEAISESLRRGLDQAARRSQTWPRRLRKTVEELVRAIPKASYTLPGDLGEVSVGLQPGDEDPPALPTLLDELNEAVRGQGRNLIVAIDEVQEAPAGGMRELVKFIHHSAGTPSPVYFLAAGLPNSIDRLHAVRTYTERWQYLRLNVLGETDTREALEIPFAQRGVQFETGALQDLIDATAGYPFFIQEYGSATWARRRGLQVSRDVVRDVIVGVQRFLEQDFYGARIRSLTPRELRYAVALATLGPGAHPTRDVAEVMNARAEAISSMRTQLIKKDVIYVPSPGMVEFRIPLTERYIERHREELDRRSR